ncbi:MAG: hypothetical protein WD030_09855 [Pirellulales bacterium]
MPDKPAIEDAATDAPLAIRWSRPVRVAVSIALLIHLTLVFCVPLSMVEPGSPLAGWLVNNMRPYVQAGNISHGYAFFAPDPGRWSHLIRYKIEFDDDRATIERTMPSLDQQWPRLLYHRHFMLTEQLGSLASRVDELNSFEAPAEERAAAERELRALATSYARHLLHAHAADRVSIDLVRHNVPPYIDVRGGRTLDDESLYETFPVSPLATAGVSVERITQPELIQAEPIPLEEVP